MTLRPSKTYKQLLTCQYLYFCTSKASKLSTAVSSEQRDRQQHTSAYVSIRQHTSAYVSIRQHTSAYASIRQQLSTAVSSRRSGIVNSEYVIRQHTSAYVSIRQHTSAYVSIRQHTSATEYRGELSEERNRQQRVASQIEKAFAHI